jgi:hypothetical protein
LYGKVTNMRAVHVCIYAHITIRFRFWFIIYVIPHVKASCSHNASTNGLRVRFSRHQYNSYWYSSLLILIRGLIFVWKGRWFLLLVLVLLFLFPATFRCRGPRPEACEYCRCGSAALSVKACVTSANRSTVRDRLLPQALGNQAELEPLA